MNGTRINCKRAGYILHQKENYSIDQSLNSYIVPCDKNGAVLETFNLTDQISVTRGSETFNSFTIGTVAKPAGFSGISVNKTNKSITISISTGTTALSDSGSFVIPIIIDGVTYNKSFTWSKAKSGNSRNDGKDAYTIKSTHNNYVVSTDNTGKIHTAVSTSTIIGALKGNVAVTPVIGTLPTVPGLSLSKSGTTVTIVFNAGTALAENGLFDIPIIVEGIAFSISFSYAKA